MTTTPPSPSPFVPGAWPASPSLKSRTRPPTNQHSPNLHCRKAAPPCGILSFRKTRSSTATTSATPDNTPSSLAPDDLSLHSSPVNTSFSSAYTTPLLPNFSFSLKKFKDRARLSLQEQDTHDIQQYPNTLDIIGNSDLADLTLPEIPDLSSLSSLRDELRISRDQFNVSSSDPVSQLCLDESFLKLHTALAKHPSLDTLSSSSIQFRSTEVLHADSLELDAEPLCFPQPDSHNSWTLFLSRRSLCSEEPSFSQARNSLTSESDCKPTSSNSAHVRRSWRVSSSLPPGFFLEQEETSTRRYANDVLDHAFNGRDGEPSLGLGISGRNNPSKLGCLCRHPLPNGPPPTSGVPSKTTFRLAMEALKKVHRMLAKFSVKNADAIRSVDTSFGQSPSPSATKQERLMATAPQSSFRVCLRCRAYQIRTEMLLEEIENTVGSGSWQAEAPFWRQLCRWGDLATPTPETQSANRPTTSQHASSVNGSSITSIAPFWETVPRNPKRPSLPRSKQDTSRQFHNHPTAIISFLH